MIRSVYIIGSLRNPKVPLYAGIVRFHGFEAFDDWYAAGPRADDHWQEYENQRGHTYAEALNNWPAKNTFAFDHRHLNRCDAAVLVLPAGKSGHLELGYFIGLGKPGYILLDKEPKIGEDRYDVMYRFAIQSGGIVTPGILEIVSHIKEGSA